MLTPRVQQRYRRVTGLLWLLRQALPYAMLRLHFLPRARMPAGSQPVHAITARKAQGRPGRALAQR